MVLALFQACLLGIPIFQDSKQELGLIMTRRKQNSQYFDPCQEAASRSIKCLHRNDGDRAMCKDYFQ